MKECTKCGDLKPFSEFHKAASHPSGLRSQCKSCAREYSVARYAKNKQYYADYRIKQRYGLSPYEYSVLESQQKGACRICLAPNKPLVVDHDHATGVVRGLLCRECNIGIGMLNDSVIKVSAALEYLKESNV